jgi:hypothetical protein
MPFLGAIMEGDPSMLTSAPFALKNAERCQMMANTFNHPNLMPPMDLLESKDKEISD